jgi:lysophospholipase L1-like esterase
MEAHRTARPSNRRLARLVRVALVALAAVVALAACQPVEAYTYQYVGTGPRVAVVGDSITAHAETEVTAALGAYARAVGGVPSMTMAAALDERVRPAVTTQPDVLVVELGLNDALDGWDSTDLPTLEKMMALLDGAECVVWVTPSALAPSYYDHAGPGTLQARAAAFKASLQKRLPKHPNQRLADFSVTELANPAWFDADHLHHTPAGHQAYADFVAQSVSLCL